jgi:Spy/CpxP family protein refolding chaperone
MKLSTRIITAVLLVVGSSGVVYAFSKHGDWGMTTDEKVEFVSERVSKELDLNEFQQQKFDALAELFAATLSEVKPARQQHIEEVSALLQEPSFNQAQALEMIEQKTQMVNARAPLLIASLAEFVDSLNLEQKAKLQEFLEHRHKHHRYSH